MGKMVEAGALLPSEGSGEQRDLRTDPRSRAQRWWVALGRSFMRQLGGFCDPQI